MKVFKLHDTTTEDILGAVCITEKCGTPKKHEASHEIEELWEGWEDYNKLEEHIDDPRSIPSFIEWFNKNYVTQIDSVDIEFIQLSAKS